MEAPVLSICVCSRNAFPSVEDTLCSVLHQTANSSQFEILYVDNGSHDCKHVKAFIESLGKPGHRVRLIFEDQTGLSHARNRAVRESRGEYVFFIDDDAVANSRLVELYIRSIQEHQPDVIGGNVLPLFEVQPSAEMDGNCWPQWSLKHFGKNDRWLQDGEYFIGTNMGAARHHLISRPFKPELGRKGDSLKGGEEWFLGESRYRRRFVSGAYVFHKVPEERMNADYMARRLLAVMDQRRQRVRHSLLLFDCLRISVLEFIRFFKRVSFQTNIRYVIWHKFNRSRL
jgi:glycosyltransferase involved in cell wall biosynthesis